MPETADLTMQAEELALTGKLDEALRMYDAAVAADHTNPLAWIGKASILKAQGKYTESAECFDAALAGIPEWEHAAAGEEERMAAFVSMLSVLKAEALLYAEKPNEALAAVDAADAVRGADAASLVIRGQALVQKKEYEAAGDCFYRAEEWCNTHEDTMLTQVWHCKIQLAKEIDGVLAPPYAAEMYARGVGFRPPQGTPDAILERGNNLRSAGLLYDALRYYDAAVTAGHQNKALILFLKGVVFEQLKRSTDALEAYSDALKADPAPDDAFRIRMRWAALRAERK
ncbi:MAG: tetratricopeptide repeat protein [Methanocorpusculum sp.]|nr:tetratricopeptide repeat protein [Methanocorpusculum sp.]